VDTSKGDGFAAGSGDMYSWATSEVHAIDNAGWLALESNGGTAGTESPRVFGDGNGAACMTFIGGPNESEERVAVRCSTDGGKTLGAPVDVDPPAQGVLFHHPIGLFVNGMITIAYWAEVNGVGEIRVAQSKDGGKTFGKPATVPKYLIPHNDLANDAQYPAIAWDGGTLWLAYLVDDGAGPHRLVVDKSCDGGTTWSGAEVVNGEPPVDDRAWPALFLADGKVAVASRQLDGDFMTSDPYEVIQLVP
jgi:hypothetical protein